MGNFQRVERQKECAGRTWICRALTQGLVSDRRCVLLPGISGEFETRNNLEMARDRCARPSVYQTRIVRKLVHHSGLTCIDLRSVHTGDHFTLAWLLAPD